MNRRSAMRKSKRFFTLVEMIVAMAVMIFVALIIATASMTFYNAWQRTVRVSDRLKTCQAIDRIMDNCIRSVSSSRENPTIFISYLCAVHTGMTRGR